MLAFDWASLGLVGVFVVGAAFGVVMTLRLAKVLAQYLTDLRKGNDHDRR